MIELHLKQLHLFQCTWFLDPAEAVEDELDGGFNVALLVGVVNSQYELASMAARVKPAEQRCADAAKVQNASRTGRKSGTDDHFSGRGNRI